MTPNDREDGADDDTEDVEPELSESGIDESESEPTDPGRTDPDPTKSNPDLIDDVGADEGEAADEAADAGKADPDPEKARARAKAERERKRAEAAAEPEPEPPTLAERLAWLRTGPRAELVSAVVFLLALPLGAVHWSGLVVGGALVGFVSPSLRRALMTGLFLGMVSLAGFAGWLWLSGVLSKALATGQVFVLTAAITLGFPILGASVRGLR